MDFPRPKPMTLLEFYIDQTWLCVTVAYGWHVQSVRDEIQELGPPEEWAEQMFAHDSGLIDHLVNGPDDAIDPILLDPHPEQPLERWWWHLRELRARTYPLELLPETLRAAAIPEPPVPDVDLVLVPRDPADARIRRVIWSQAEQWIEGPDRDEVLRILDFGCYYRLLEDRAYFPWGRFVDVLAEPLALAAILRRRFRLPPVLRERLPRPYRGDWAEERYTRPGFGSIPSRSDASEDNDPLRYYADRLRWMYCDITQKWPEAYDLMEFALLDRSRIEGRAEYAELARWVDAHWRYNPAKFNRAMRAWHTPEARAEADITDPAHWWWWPLPVPARASNRGGRL